MQFYGLKSRSSFGLWFEKTFHWFWNWFIAQEKSHISVFAVSDWNLLNGRHISEWVIIQSTFIADSVAFQSPISNSPFNIVDRELVLQIMPKQYFTVLICKSNYATTSIMLGMTAQRTHVLSVSDIQCKFMDQRFWNRFAINGSKVNRELMLQIMLRQLFTVLGCHNNWD